MQKFIIVKYADLLMTYEPQDSAYKSYTAKECGVTQQFYDTEKDAESDINKMKEFNPTVGYGVVPVEV